MPWCGEDPRKTVTPGFAAGETFCEPSWRCCCLLEMLFLGGTKLLFHKGGFKSLTCCADSLVPSPWVSATQGSSQPLSHSSQATD